MADKKRCDLKILCLEGALLQAVRDIMHGYPDWRIVEFIRRRYQQATEQDALDVIALAHRGIVAAGQLSKLPGDESLPPGAIPSLPK